MAKYVFVTGGVVSGIGKGIAASSIALLLKSRGYKIFMQKFDPYINVDPGLMSPLQHGEVYITADGSETDLDLGHYERFIDEELNYSSSISNGKVYSKVLENERKGKYGGKTVQIIPHITGEIKRQIFEGALSSEADIIITEIGGTIGDIESGAIIEALRQIRYELGQEATLFVHTTLIPSLFGSGELKTKPTQHTVMELRSLGIQPDIILCRTPVVLNEEIKEKISLFCSIPKNNVLNAIDAKIIYEIPLNFHKEKIDELILNQFNLPLKEINLTKWETLLNNVDNLKKEVNIAIIGKYIALPDAYLSVKEALNHAGYELGTKIKIKWINHKEIKDNIEILLKEIDGIVIPYGPLDLNLINFVKHIRLNNIPFLGLDLGFQIAILEYATNVCNLNNDDIITNINDYKTKHNIPKKRIGNYNCLIKENTIAYNLYQTNSILERHRHTLEFNLKYKEILEENKLIFSGLDKQTNLVEIMELNNHPYFIACQFRAEFKSRPTKAHPLFLGLITAILKQQS